MYTECRTLLLTCNVIDIVRNYRQVGLLGIYSDRVLCIGLIISKLMWTVAF